MALHVLFRLGKPAQTGGYKGLLAFWSGGAAQGAAVEETPTGRGTGGWGAGLNAKRRRVHTLPTPLSRLDKKDLPPKPVIVKPTTETPATVLLPGNDEREYEEVLQIVIWLDESGILDE